MTRVFSEIHIGAGVSLPEILAEYEREIVAAALLEAIGVKTTAAALIGIHRTTLIEKMKRYNLDGVKEPSRKREPK